MKQVSVVGPKFDPEFDSKLFEPDQVLVPLVPEDRTMAHLLHRIGKFPSVGQAKRAGWDKPVPTGFTMLSIGRGPNQMDIEIWNPTCTLAEFRAANPDLDQGT